MEIMVEFILFSPDFPVEEVYEQIGLEGEMQRLSEASFPTLSNGNYIREKECSITYSTGYVETIDVGDPVEKIFNMLHSQEELIISCIKSHKLQSKFCIVINLTDNPIIGLSKKFVDMASRLQASIELDSYVNYNRRGKVRKAWTLLNFIKRGKKTGGQFCVNPFEK